MDPWKRRFLLETSIFELHVGFLLGVYSRRPSDYPLQGNEMQTSEIWLQMVVLDQSSISMMLPLQLGQVICFATSVNNGKSNSYMTHNDPKETRPLRSLFTPQWVMNICLLYSHTTQVWRSVVGGHDSRAPIQPLDCWNFLKNGPLWANFFPSYENLSQAVPLTETFQRHSAQLTFYCHPFSTLFNTKNRKSRFSGGRASWFWRTSGSTDDNRGIRSRSVATRKIEGPHGLRWPPGGAFICWAEKWEFNLHSKISWKHFWGEKNDSPAGWPSKTKNTHTFLLPPFPTCIIPRGLARGFQHITSQRLKNWLSPRIRVKLIEKKMCFTKKLNPPF